MSPITKNLALPVDVLSMLQHASTLHKISQYCVLPDKQDQLDFIVYNSPGEPPPPDPELPLSGKSSPLQTIFLVRASGKPNYLEARVSVPTHWDLDLLEFLLVDYDDKLTVDFLRFGWPMSRSILPLTNGLANVNHKGALQLPDAINHYPATQHSNNTLLGPFFTSQFPDRTASSMLDSVPKRD